MDLVLKSERCQSKRPPSECLRLPRAFVRDLDLHILFTSRFALHNSEMKGNFYHISQNVEK